MRRIGSFLVAGLLVLVMAVTPLRAFISGGIHEASMPASGLMPWSLPVRVIVEDVSGMVLGISATAQRPPPSLPDDRLVVVSWLGGCSDQGIWLNFHKFGDGYRIIKRETSNGCGFMIGTFRTVVMVTRLPIDPARVSFNAPEADIS
jgi:hypothetical protein